MWSFVVALPAIQAEFAVARAEASLPYTMAMIGYALGGVLIGRLTDRLGIVAPILIGATALCVGFITSTFAPTIWEFALLYAFVGFGSSTTFAPLMADVSHWFMQRRGLAVAICASGNYAGGAIWPPVVEHFLVSDGWRHTQIGIGLFCLATMLPLAFLLRRRLVVVGRASAHSLGPGSRVSIGLRPWILQILLCLAGVACCVAMSMPQVHIVAYCADLGYGVARGAEMLSLMLGFGIVSRIASGFIADRIGGLATLLAGSTLQCLALLFYLLFDGLTSLYVISALFGLFQGGIVPMYAVLVRDFFPPHEAGLRLGLTVSATIAGMALGGWLSGAIFDLTGSYAQAFGNGVLWNLLNMLIVLFLMQRHARRRAAYA
jgi:MFS family permease